MINLIKVHKKRKWMSSKLINIKIQTKVSSEYATNIVAITPVPALVH